MDAAKKRRIKSGISWFLMGAMVLMVVGISLKDNLKKNASADLLVQSAVVTKGSLESTIRGGGKLSLEKSSEIEILGDVKIASWLVEPGSMVEAGEAVAKVDPVSLDQEILNVETAIAKLTEKIAAAQEETKVKVTAPVSGRVKQIYAAEGEDVLTVMMRDGALALLSLDGQMQVELEVESDLVPGDSVEIEILPPKDAEEEESGSEKASENSDATTSSAVETGAFTEPAPVIAVGRVETNLNGKLLITVPDEGYAVDSTVIIRADGRELGEGVLMVHDAWKLTDVTGTIKEIHIKEEQQVKMEDLLLTIELSSDSLAGLLNEREEYQAVLFELLSLKENGIITAPADGKIEDFLEEIVIGLLPMVEPGLLDGSLAALGTSGVTAAGRTVFADEETPAGPPAGTPTGSPTGTPSGGTGADGSGADDTLAQQILLMLFSGNYTGYPGTLVNVAVETGQIQALVTAEGIPFDSITSLMNLSAIDPATMNQPATFSVSIPIYKIEGGNMTQAVPADLTTGTNLLLVRDASGKDQMAILMPSSLVSNEEEQTVSDFDPALMEQLMQLQGVDAAQLLQLLQLMQDMDPAQLEQLMQLASMQNMDMTSLMAMYGGIDLSALYGGMDMSGFGNGSAEEKLYEIRRQSIAKVTPQQWMEFQIPVDELDISKVYVGQKADVTIEAFPDELYEGTITKISPKATSSGGNAKFAVTIRIVCEEGMLEGMSASAMIPIEPAKAETAASGTEGETSGDVLLIPIEAVQEDGARLFVYTAYDPQKNELLAPVDIEIGLSDEQLVQVISPLEEGMTVFYPAGAGLSGQ
ncbi:MAG: HlyD family efflux transporter periplasmic adaptor subunit [Firmicutes bacterium]|nr:HlyD family efflux transporter periplasmic adaptor subunit [Bacillota bacterium]